MPRRQRPRPGAPRAAAAAAHDLARILYRLMRFGGAHVKQTEQQYAERSRQRQQRQLARRARGLGYELKKAEAGPAEQER